MVALSACLVALPADASSGHHATAHRARSQPVLAKQGPVMLSGCRAGTIEASVTIPRAVFAADQQVTVRANVRNVGTTPCGYPGSSGTPQEAGPCGMISMEIENAKGVDVWPGKRVYSCPALFEESIVPGGTVVVVGSWSRDEATAVLPGKYRLIVGRLLVFSITLR
jgi:hypothetical protein